MIGDALEIQAAGITDVGLKREGNEDSFSTEDSYALYVVADGMGGHLAGEVASGIAVEMINKSFRRFIDTQPPLEELFGNPDATLTLMGNYLSSSIQLANRVVYEMAREYDQYHGMGTTVAAVHITPELIFAANAGDSRIYLIRDGRVERLSRDHTIVSEQVEMGMMTEEEAETSPLKHVLTRNLGSSEEVSVDVFEIQPMNNDRLVLCSDGLTDLVSDEEILHIASAGDDPEAICRHFVETVLRRGAHDNTTVITVFISGMSRAKEPALKKIAFLFADLIIGVQKLIKKFKP
jgi:protein phosphatase